MSARCSTHRGFTLVEMCLVVTVIGILAAVATPGIARARGSAMEASTIGSLRAINSAQTAYASSCAAGSYAPTIAWLTRAPRPGAATFLGAEFTPTPLNRQGYNIVMTQGARVTRAPRSCNGLAAGQAVDGYFVAADRLTTSAASVRRYFGMNAAGIIYQSNARIRPILTGAPPAPAKPIQ